MRDLALRLYRQRRVREKELPGMAGLWGDHAWDMLLDLLVAAEEGRRLDVKSVCLAGCVPSSTGLRLIDRLIRVGMIRRTANALDRRKSMVALTAEGHAAMRRHLEGIRSQSLGDPLP